MTTDLSSPGPPIISNLTCQDENTLYVQWLRPAKVYGSVDLYYIYYRPEDAFTFDEIAINSVNNRMENNVSKYYYFYLSRDFVTLRNKGMFFHKKYTPEKGRSTFHNEVFCC